MKTVLNLICRLFGYRAVSPDDLIKNYQAELGEWKPTPPAQVFAFFDVEPDPEAAHEANRFCELYDIARKTVKDEGRSVPLVWNGIVPNFDWSK